MFSNKLSILPLIASVLTIISGTQAQNLVNALSKIPELSKLAALLQPYATTLATFQNITFVAPNNAAVDILANSSIYATLAADPTLSQALMRYHILNGTYPEYFGTSSEEVFLPSALQPPTWTNVTGGQRVEIIASSGNQAATVYSGLRQVANITNYTSFSGGDLYISDRFLTIPQNVTTTALGLNLTSAVGALTPLGGISLAFDIYADATIFLPDNEAFQQVGGNLANMTSTEISKILEYHATAQQVFYSPELQDGTIIGTLFGNLTITRSGTEIYVNNARIIQSDTLTSNGVLHVIDRVLNPADPSASIGAQAFPQASSVTYVPFTSGVPTATSYIPITGYTSSPTSGSSPASNADSGNGSGSKSDTAAIAGGVVGGILGLALILVMLWFIRRKGSNKTDDPNRRNTSTSYRKPELEATTRNELGDTLAIRSELESTTTAHSQSGRASKPLTDPAVYEIGQPKTPLINLREDHAHAQVVNNTATSETSSRQDPPRQQEQATSERWQEEAREQQRQQQRDQQEQEARMTEVENQRRLADLEYQRRMTELEHEQRITELDMSAARIRSHGRSVSELDARAYPGSRYGDGDY